jgi:hypothetical protein
MDVAADRYCIATLVVDPGSARSSVSLAWVSHFFVEHNRPASFEHPLWSWLANQRMVALMLAGKMNQEVRRFTLEN